MILLATNKRDITTDFIVMELERRGIPYFRFNTEDLPQAVVRFEPTTGWILAVGDVTINLQDVKAGYYRRPGTPEVSAEVNDQATKEYLVNEWSAVLRSLWNAIEGRWLNSPFAILRAEDKPRQLCEAQALGFEIPDTFIGNDIDVVVEFAAENPTIGKPLRHALIDKGPNGQVLFTQKIQNLKIDDRKAVEVAPVIYQREIIKAYDVRVTVVQNKVFAVAIHSQDQQETELDWRRGSRIDITHQNITLPDELALRCCSLAQVLGLNYGAVDLIRDVSGRYWFLEINPNGQWAWIEHRTGSPISSAIVDALMDIAS
jgi:glutathione synthase/RimK-type ligase-like ATP-grasp enzyme